METLYVIGKGAYARGTRLSPNSALAPDERVWGVFTAEKAQPFIDALDERFRERKIGEGHYATSPDVVVGHILNASMCSRLGIIEFSAEVRDLIVPDHTITYVRRVKPTQPQS